MSPGSVMKCRDCFRQISLVHGKDDRNGDDWMALDPTLKKPFFCPCSRSGKHHPKGGGWGRFWNSLGNALGESLFGGNR